MKNLILCICISVFIVGTALGQSGNKELEKLRNGYITALKNSDTPVILKMYADDATIHHIDGTLYTGTSEIKGLYDQFFEKNKAEIKFENVSEDELSKGVLFYHDNVFLDLDTEEETVLLEVVNIAEKIDGKWRVTKSYRWPVSSN